MVKNLWKLSSTAKEKGNNKYNQKEINKDKKKVKNKDMLYVEIKKENWERDKAQMRNENNEERLLKLQPLPPIWPYFPVFYMSCWSNSLEIEQ